MAITYVVLPSYAPMDTDSITRLGVAAARRALALDSSLVEGHLALANALANGMRLEEAEAEYRRVIALAPNNPTVHQWYASCLLGMGRVEEALAASQRAVALDPLSAVIVNDQAAVLLSARRYDDAFVAARLALELDSTFSYTRIVLAWLHGVTGHPDSALAQLGLDPPMDPGLTWRGSGWRGVAAWAYSIAGRRVDAERVRAEIAREPGRPSPYDEAMAALALGDREGAVTGLARSLERHELLGLDPSPGCTPVFDPLHRLSTFRRLMARYDIRVCER
jgi:tetratricopeptide (TPR) repeat protein